MLPVTEKDWRSRAPKGASRPEPHLFVVLEGGRPTAGGMRCSLRGVREVALGRGGDRFAERAAQSGRLVVTLPDPQVSLRHARLVRSRGGWRLEDDASTNGTFLNGRRVTHEPLADGDLIQLGQCVLRLRLDLPTRDDTPDFSDGSDPGSVALGMGTLLPALSGELAMLAKVAGSAMPVLLMGETGTGKEVSARAVHAASGRRGALVAVNCAALADSLLEAQLFGHVKGAFTGAVRDEIGFVRRAHEGTLFLDEIGDLSPSAQGALLRALQEGEVVPVGTTTAVMVQMRVVAATHHALEAMVDRGEFRRDLFARLSGFTHRLWPLCDRREDIGLLVAHWLGHSPAGAPAARELRFAHDAARALVQHSWPLNVRELVHALAHAAAFAETETIELSHLPSAVTASPSAPAQPPAVPPGMSPGDAALRGELVRALRSRRGNVAAVAREMNKAPMQIYRWMQRLEIDPKAFR